MFEMLRQHLFVNLIIILQTGAVIDYSFSRKWLLAGYWLLGLLTNVAITYGIKK
jgi:hypothetical protein